jgi:hypothetical protein
MDQTSSPDSPDGGFIITLVVSSNVLEIWMPASVALALGTLLAMTLPRLFARRPDPELLRPFLRVLPFLLFAFIGVNGLMYLNCRSILPIWAHGLLFAGYILLFRWLPVVVRQEPMKIAFVPWLLVSGGVGFLLTLIPFEGPCTLIN